jgi:hypothetical protein
MQENCQLAMTLLIIGQVIAPQPPTNKKRRSPRCPVGSRRGKKAEMKLQYGKRGKEWLVGD